MEKPVKKPKKAKVKPTSKKNFKPKKTTNFVDKKEEKVIPKISKVEKKEVKKVVTKKVEKAPKPKHNQEDSIFDLVSMRINETLKTERKNTSPRNNPYFWIVKAFLLIISIFLTYHIFEGFKEVGTELIYEINKSLRSILSGIWQFTVSFMKNILILYLVYSNIKLFVESPYYERLYKNDTEMRLNKEIIFDRLLKILKVLSIPFLFILLLLASTSLFLFFYFIFIWANGTSIISPFIISIAVIFISYLAYKHILVGFFDAKYRVNKNNYILALLIILFGSMLLFFELKEFKYDSNLPESVETIKQINTFDISGKDNIIIKNNSKLNNIKIYQNNNLKDEIKIYVEYYKTAKVEHIYKYNDDNNLILKFDSDTKFRLSDVYGLLGMIEKGLIDKTIYNYNLYKYPNIKIYVNEFNTDRIFIK